MTAPGSTHRERVLRALRLAPQPLDDDELARRAQIAPRQAVNQVCRGMVREGLLRRVDGPTGKIVNVLVDRDEDPPSVDDQAPLSTAPGDAVVAAGAAGEQRAAEVHLLRGLSLVVGRDLSPAKISLPSGVRVEVDGSDPGRTVLAECWAHIGPVKGAQRLKVLTDAFKLTWIADNIPGRPRLILCMADDDAAAPFRNPRAWYAQALADRGVEIIVVPLPDDVRAAVLRAQQRQYR